MMNIWNAFEDIYITNQIDIEQYIEDLYKTLIADQEIIDQQEKTIEELEKTIEELEKTIEELRKVVSKVPGRHEKLSSSQKETIRKMRRMGVPLQEIADKYKCSLPVIHKITKDLDVDLRRKGSQKAHIRTTKNDL